MYRLHELEERRLAHIRKLDTVAEANPLRDAIDTRVGAASAYMRLGLQLNPSESKKEKAAKLAKFRKRPSQQPENVSGLAKDSGEFDTIRSTGERRKAAARRKLLKKRGERPVLDKLPEPGAEKGYIGRPISEHEATSVSNLITKYDKDYRAMSQDIDLNPYQYKPRELQRKVLNYLKWERAALGKQFAAAEAAGLQVESVEAFSDPALRRGAGVSRVGGKAQRVMRRLD